MDGYVCKALMPDLGVTNDVKISKVKIHWYETDNGFINITGLQFKWSNNSTETDWSDMLGNGEVGKMPDGVTASSNNATFSVSEGDYLNEVRCAYAPPGGGWNTALNGIQFVTKNGVQSQFYGRKLSEEVTQNTFSVPTSGGQIYGCSGSFEGNAIFTLGFTANFRTDDIAGS